MFGFGFWRRDDSRRRLAMAHAALPESAAQRGDPPKIAAHLGTTEAALFAEYLVVDESDSGAALVVYPRRRQWNGGHYLTDAETYGVDTPCVFLGDDGCQIHEVKPAGGVRYKCWDEATHGEPPGCEWTEEQVMALGWDGDRYQGDDE